MSGASQHTPNNGQTVSGAMLQNNMYAWVADGLGRLDVSNSVNVEFEYDAITSKSKRRIANPLAHIQFAASLNAIRTMYSGYDGSQTVRYKNNKYSDRTSFEMIDRDSTMGTYNTISGGVANVQMRKTLLKPVIDEFQLIPQLVADASGLNPYRMDLSFDTVRSDGDVDLSYVNFLYSNVAIAPGVARADAYVASGNSKINTNTESIFHIVDMSNGGDTGENEDASYNIIAAFKIYAKYNHAGTGAAGTTDGPTIQTWPETELSTLTSDTSQTYTVDGFPVTLRSRTNKEPAFSFNINDDGAAGSGGGLEDCSYIVQVLYGDLTDMSFVKGVGGRVNQDCSFICTGSLMANSATEVLTTRATLYSELPTQGVDLSFVSKTLSSTSILENNEDSYLGDILLPIVGIADICGGLQCVHVPDSLKNIRTDAASSLASNFAGLAELMGNISFTTADDVSAGEINVLAYNDTSGNGMDGSANNDINGLFTISGDILTNKLRNVMLGGTITQTTSSAFLSTSSDQHIHKVIYSSYGNATTNPDVSNACLARDLDLFCMNVNSTTGACDDISAAGINDAKPAGYALAAATGRAAALIDVSCEIAELTPQESAFFYLYPWASPQMCAIGSQIEDPYALNGFSDFSLNAGVDSALSNVGITTAYAASSPGTAGDDKKNIKDAALTCNPFRHFQEKYIKINGSPKAYSEILELNSIKAAIPTAEGWMDCSHGYYNVSKNRTEWYSFVDICYNNSFNAIQTSDATYVYQNYGDNTQGRFKLSILDIVFPDVSGLALNDFVSDAQDDSNGFNNDFCTLNFQIPLKGTTDAADKRFAKINNLNAGQIQLANESYTLKSGFTAKCTARADKLTLVSANITELMNAYMPVVVRLMDEATIGNPLEDANGANVDLTKGPVDGSYGS